MHIFIYYKNLIARNAKWIHLIVILFVLSGLFGALFYSYDPSLFDEIKEIMKRLRGDAPLQSLEHARQLFTNNARSLLLQSLGAFSLGLISLLAMLVNGFIVGFAVAMAVVRSLPSWWQGIAFSIAALLPHGIFELSAVIITSALSTKTGIRFLATSHRGRRASIFATDLKELLSFIPLGLFLLSIAALIESLVTGRILEVFFR